MPRVFPPRLRPRPPGRIDLAKRGGQRRGWAISTFTLYGKPTAKRYKTFVATWRPAGGTIRVVLVDEPKGWVAFFCSDPAAGVADILGNVAGRFSLEVTFRDVKEIIGAGQQQVRSVAGNVGAFHLCAWAFTLTEAWAWGRAADDLVGHPPLRIRAAPGYTTTEPTLIAWTGAKCQIESVATPAGGRRRTPHKPPRQGSRQKMSPAV